MSAVCKLHSRSAIKYAGSKGKLLFKNSWGAWGDDGFGTLSINAINFGYGAYAYKNVRIWAPEEFTPKLDQTSLAVAVNRFVVSTGLYDRVWDSRYDLRRASLYNQALISTGLSP